jgi:hypothetical protein
VKGLILTGALLAAVLAGCGSSSPTRTYSLGKTKACLLEKPVRLGGQLDFVATTAPGGATRVTTDDNFVTVVFGQSATDGDNIAAAYRHFAAPNVGVNDVLDQNQNAVLLWHKHPSQDDLDLVQGCLK